MIQLIERSSWHRPIVMGRDAMVSSGHHLASLAGIEILRKGGNAIDAGVAMGLCLNVAHVDLTNFGGVAPIMIYSASEDKVITLNGVGPWPKAASAELIHERGGRITQNKFTSSVVPAAPDAWITALDLYGTMSFSEVAKRAVDLAENGFPAHPFFINNVIRWAKQDRFNWNYTLKVLCPSGTVPSIGELIMQKDLARTFKRLIKVEQRNLSQGRHSALMAVRDEFYKGDIAKDIIEYIQKEGGVMTLEDFADYHTILEEPVMTTYRDIDVYCCGPWTQGPMNNMILNILERYNLNDNEHNSFEHIHLMSSAFNLAFADRYQYIGDPNFVDVPIKELTSKKYAEVRSQLIREDKAWTKMAPPGDPRKMKASSSFTVAPKIGASDGSSPGTKDTSYGCVVDKEGNAFSATPSDGGRLIPGLGILASPRGRQAWLDPDHPNSVQSGKRPRLTPNPALAFKDGKFFMAYGTPGGDTQPQTMVQTLVNIVDFNMNVQEAIEAPRFISMNWPDSFWPHNYLPGRLNVERNVHQKVMTKLEAMGYDLNILPEWSWQGGGVCAIHVGDKQDVLMGGADPRRECYAIGY